MNRSSLLRRLRQDQRGQILASAAVMMMLLLALCCISVDFGTVYFAYRELRGSTDAAAMAGAQNLSAYNVTSTSVTTAATTYSSVSGNKNVFNTLTSVSMVTGYPKLKCLTTVTGWGISCVTIAGVTNGANAVQVEQTAKVPLTFAGLFGMKTATIYATSTAAMRGASRAPYNVALILDTTGSMGSSDGGTNCAYSRLTCALLGLQVFLQDLSPCMPGGACNAVNGISPHPVDQVSLFVFPPVVTSTAKYDYSSGSVQTVHYQSPLPSTDTYQIVSTSNSSSGNYGFLSDYRTSDSAASLNPSSDFVLATDTTSSHGTVSPTYMQNPGGSGTYYAGIIYAAQAALVNAQSQNPSSTNVMIILSDGQAQAGCGDIVGTYNMIWSNPTGKTKAPCQTPAPAANSATFPSLTNQCQQAVAAAVAAASAGTTIYTVGYGSTAAAGSCSTDTYNGDPYTTACATMQAMASKSTNFYTDYTSSTNGCSGATTNSLSQIFTAIAGNLTSARLIPNNTP
jgi:Flp pilus assembly protein TadG